MVFVWGDKGKAFCSRKTVLLLAEETYFAREDQVNSEDWMMGKWMPVKDYEEQYMVSRSGDVYSWEYADG